MAEHGHAERYRQHILDGDEPCAACREAERVKKARYRKARILNRGPMLVDATGTRRRVQALAAIGWSASALGESLGYDRSTVSRWTQVPRVHVTTERRVIALFERLAMTPGPSDTVRRVAATNGWPPPLAWDDETIDDPAALPAVGGDPVDVDDVLVMRAVYGETVELNRSERREAIRILSARGLGAKPIAAHLGMHPRQVERERKAAA